MARRPLRSALTLLCVLQPVFAGPRDLLNWNPLGQSSMFDLIRPSAMLTQTDGSLLNPQHVLSLPNMLVNSIVTTGNDLTADFARRADQIRQRAQQVHNAAQGLRDQYTQSMQAAPNVPQKLAQAALGGDEDDPVTNAVGSLLSVPWNLVTAPANMVLDLQNYLMDPDSIPTLAPPPTPEPCVRPGQSVNVNARVSVDKDGNFLVTADQPNLESFNATAADSKLEAVPEVRTTRPPMYTAKLTVPPRTTAAHERTTTAPKSKAKASASASAAGNEWGDEGEAFGLALRGTPPPPPDAARLDELVDSLPVEGMVYGADAEGKQLVFDKPESDKFKQGLKDEMKKRMWDQWVEKIVAYHLAEPEPLTHVSQDQIFREALRSVATQGWGKNLQPT